MPPILLTALTPRLLWSPPDSQRDRPVMGALLGQRCALIVETGASPAHAAQFRAALAETGTPAPRFAAVTHWHWDHVFGTTEWNLPTIGHLETRRRVLEMAHLDWRDRALDLRVAEGKELAFIAEHVKVELSNAERAALVITAPDLTFSERVALDLGSLSAQVIHVGGDHAADSSVVLIPEERVAFLGDCYYNGFIGNVTFYTLPRLFPLLAALEALPVDTYILAHHPQPLSRAAFLLAANRLRRIGEIVAKTGPDRSAALAGLSAALGETVDHDDLEDMDSFLKGLELSSES